MNVNLVLSLTSLLLIYSLDSAFLLPSLPLGVTFDKISGIGFTSDLNDNVAAPWPSGHFVSASSCNKTRSIAPSTSSLPLTDNITKRPLGCHLETSASYFTSSDILFLFRLKLHSIDYKLETNY